MGRNEEGSWEGSLDEALRQHPLLILTRPAKFHSPTFEIPAAPEAELFDLHALEHIDVAWGSGGAEKE